MRLSACLMSGVLLLLVRPLLAQDPVKSDPKHYKVEFENDRVRALRVTYGPGEKSPLHAHPAHVAVFLTDGKIRIPSHHGKTALHDIKRGGVGFAEAESHAPENVGDRAFELVVVELRSQEVPQWLQNREAAWVKAYNAGNGAALAQMWVPDGVLLLHGDIVRGRGAIEKLASRKNSCSFPITGAHVLDQLAVVWGESHCPGAAGAAPHKGEWMRAYERQPDGSWLIVRDTGQ